MSGNNITILGLRHICNAIIRTDSLRTFHIAKCEIDNDGIEELRLAMSQNPTIKNFDCQFNNVFDFMEQRANAEAEANNLLDEILKAPLEFDTGKLTKAVNLFNIYSLLFFFIVIFFFLI